jgi:hypothetical protein
MSGFDAKKLPVDPDGLELRRTARATIAAFEAILKHAAFVSNLDFSVLAAIAADPKSPPRERRRAAEVLAAFRIKTLDKIADLSAAREQSLNLLGLDADRGTRGMHLVINVGVPEVVRGAILEPEPPGRPRPDAGEGDDPGGGGIPLLPASTR